MMFIDNKLDDIGFLIEGKAYNSAIKELKKMIKTVKRLKRKGK